MERAASIVAPPRSHVKPREDIWIGRRCRRMVRRMKRLVTLLALLLTSSNAFADGRVGDIIGKVAKIRIDVLDDTHKQVFITDAADVAAVLAAIGLDQRPRNPTNNVSFDLNLDFFDAKGEVHSLLGFKGGIGNRNHLMTLAFSSNDLGSVTLADAEALRKIVARYVGAKDKGADGKANK
jgi:hypothetical protein